VHSAINFVAKLDDVDDDDGDDDGLLHLLLNLSIPDVPFPVLLSTLIRSRSQAKPATFLIPIDFFLSFLR
jgi:hypothetical protein